MLPKVIIARFDGFLTERALRLEAVVVGGTALALLGVLSRPTQDCDIIHPDLSQAIRNAAVEFAALLRGEGEALADDWLNNGPAAVGALLPEGWLDRLQDAYTGRALVLRSLGRLDLLRTKLFALCDRSFDLPDCIALAPTAQELAEILPWLVLQDAHPGWPDHVRTTFADLEERLGDGL